MPRRALTFLSGIALWGAAGSRTLLEGQESLPANPDKNDGAQEASGIRSPFLWILSFGEAKESISPVGARTHIQTTVALATHCCVHLSTNSGRTAFLLISWFDSK
jgi:hypothetical protein